MGTLVCFENDTSQDTALCFRSHCAFCWHKLWAQNIRCSSHEAEHGWLNADNTGREIVHDSSVGAENCFELRECYKIYQEWHLKHFRINGLLQNDKAQNLPVKHHTILRYETILIAIYSQSHPLFDIPPPHHSITLRLPPLPQTGGMAIVIFPMMACPLYSYPLSCH